MLSEHCDEADLLAGTRRMGQFLGLGSRQVLYLVERRRTPFFRIGGTIYSRKTTLRNWMEEQERLAAVEASEGHSVEHGAAA